MRNHPSLDSRPSTLDWSMNDSYELPDSGPRSRHEELANSITHGLGFLISVIGSAILMTAAIAGGDAWSVGGCAIYSVALMLVYLASTLSHTFHRPDLKHKLRVLDQAFIYLLVVGTYTPWGMIFLREGWPLVMMIVMWTIALAGFVSKVFFSHRIESVSTWIYVALGWMPVLAIRPILETVPHNGLWWMFAGGICYTVGVIFLKFDHHVPFFHAVWHKFVIAGSVCHWVAIYFFAVPR